MAKEAATPPEVKLLLESRQRLNLFLNVLREASPLAAFRRNRTSFGKLHLWRLSERSFTSGASFGKLHLWRLSERSSGRRRGAAVFTKVERLEESTQ